MSRLATISTVGAKPRIVAGRLEKRARGRTEVHAEDLCQRLAGVHAAGIGQLLLGALLPHRLRLQLLLERLEAELTQLREVRPPGGGAGLRERIPGLIVELVLLGRELQGRACAPCAPRAS